MIKKWNFLTQKGITYFLTQKGFKVTYILNNASWERQTYTPPKFPIVPKVDVNSQQIGWGFFSNWEPNYTWLPILKNKIWLKNGTFQHKQGFKEHTGFFSNWEPNYTWLPILKNKIWLKNGTFQHKQGFKEHTYWTMPVGKKRNTLYQSMFSIVPKVDVNSK